MEVSITLYFINSAPPWSSPGQINPELSYENQRVFRKDCKMSNLKDFIFHYFVERGRPMKVSVACSLLLMALGHSYPYLNHSVIGNYLILALSVFLLVNSKDYKYIVGGTLINIALVWWSPLDAEICFTVSASLLVTAIAFAGSEQIRSSHFSNIELQKVKSIYHSRLSALSEMSSGMAHEINNPLTIIQGYASQLISLEQRGQVTGDKVVNAAQKILDTSERISKIVRSLRAIARDGENEPFLSTPLHQILEETLEFCRARFKNHSIKLLVSAIPQHINVECRAVQIAQVLLNILNNAYDAAIASNEKWVKIEFADLGRDIEIAVSDSGVGIPKEIASKIFEPFFTTKEVGKGAGLGLSISMGLIKNHNGKFYLDKNSKNTCFVVHLPKQQNYDVIDNSTSHAA